MGYQTLVTYEEGQDKKQNSKARSDIELVDEREIRETVRVRVDLTDPDIQKYIRKTVAILCNQKGLRGEEEDIVGEVFLKASIAQVGAAVFRGEAAVKTWLHRIAHNECEN